MAKSLSSGNLSTLFVYSCALSLLGVSSLAEAQQCPPPYAWWQPYGGAWIEGQYRYAYPGQLLSATMVVTNGVSPCSTSGEDWYNSNWIHFYNGVGYGWQEWIHQGASDCRTQHWSIPIPFANADDWNVQARYYHPKAWLDIHVIDYPNPGPDCRTTDMDPVNTYTGALNITEEDYSNSDLALLRYYDPIALAGIYKADSSERWKNPIGYGWQHNCNIYIEEIRQINISPPDTILRLC